MNKLEKEIEEVIHKNTPVIYEEDEIKLKEEILSLIKARDFRLIEIFKQISDYQKKNPCHLTYEQIEKIFSDEVGNE